MPLFFRTGEVSEIVGVSKPTLLQAVEQLGISPIRKNGRGDRLFNLDQVNRLHNHFAERKSPAIRFERALSEVGRNSICEGEVCHA